MNPEKIKISLEYQEYKTKIQIFSQELQKILRLRKVFNDAELFMLVHELQNIKENTIFLESKINKDANIEHLV